MTDRPSEILTAITNKIVDAVVETIGESRVTSVLLAGSAAKGEIASYDGDQFLEIYSDLDIYVVVSDGSDLEALRRQVAALIARVPLRGDSFRVYAAPDVGVVTPGDLASQPVRPGTVDIGRAHRVIYGVGDPVGGYGDFEPAAIPVEEALYLLENRILEGVNEIESIRRESRPDAERYARYIMIKSGIDAITAVLVAHRSYHPDRREREKLFDDSGLKKSFESVLPDNASEIIESCRSKRENLQTALAANNDTAEDIYSAVQPMLTALWLRLAADIAETDEIESVSWRCKNGRHYQNLRELLVVAKRMSVNRASVMTHSRMLSRLSAIDALRVAGIAQAVMESSSVAQVDVKGVYLPYIERLTRLFGEEAGSPFERARRLHKRIA